MDWLDMHGDQGDSPTDHARMRAVELAKEDHPELFEFFDDLIDVSLLANGDVTIKRSDTGAIIDEFSMED